MSIEIRNAEQVKHILETVTPRVSKNLVRSTVHGVAGEVRDEIKRVAPDDPRTRKGDIKRTTKSKRERQRGSYFSSTVRIGAFYWKFLEFGTVKISARNFVLRSAEKIRPKLPVIFRKQFGSKLEAALKRANK